MDKVMTKQESYVERRQLFKNIWETAMHIGDKEDIMNKPRVIKTLRLDEVDKYPVGKTKKQRLKNLRHVCNKILDFCDRQDQDDKQYQQLWRKKVSLSAGEDDVSKPKWFAYEIMESILTPIYESEIYTTNLKEWEENMAAGVEANQPQNKEESKIKKKPTRLRKKIKRAKSLFVPRNITVARTTTSEKEECVTDLEKASRPTSPLKLKRTIRAKSRSKRIRTGKSVRLKGSPERSTKVAKKQIVSDVPGETTTVRRKIVKKKLSKRKKKSNSADIVVGATSRLT